MLALKDENGFVFSSNSGLQREANITEEEFAAGIKCLESPDNDSRTKENDGIRVKKIDGGWVVLNHSKYRVRESLKREKTRERVRRFRENLKKGNACNAGVCVTSALPSVSVSDKEGGVGGEEQSVTDDPAPGSKEYIASVEEETQKARGIINEKQRLLLEKIAALKKEKPENVEPS